LNHVILLLKRLGFILLLYFLCRVLFLISNYSYFESAALLKAFLGGLRFDLSAIALINSPFILLSLVPHPWLGKKGYQRFLLSLMILLNLPGILMNLIDMEYFKFTSQRSSSEFFDMILLGDDFLKLLPDYLLDYWYLLLAFLALAFLMIRYVTRAEFPQLAGEKTHYLWHSLAVILFAGLIVLTFRGGFQLRPMNNLSAMAYGRPQDVPLILNTPFTIISSVGKDHLDRATYFDEKELDIIYSPVHHLPGRISEKKNVFILIMESFSTEYVGQRNEKGIQFTPFIDSIAQVSQTFEFTYANGRRSLEALPSIMAGLPMLMKDPFITSSYAGNSLDGIPRILARHGYSSSFFHGCTIGSMAFDTFCASAGFDTYYGMEDYPEQKDYDGAWGIFDGPFFNFAYEKIKLMPEPFIASIFSISSHHPYAIPEGQEEQYSDFEDGLGRTVRYSDQALKDFFANIKQHDFFKRSIFIITADHIPNTENPAFRTPLGAYSVPIVIYDPSENFESSCRIAQHIDIQPTLIDYLGLKENFIGFGKSLYRSDENWAVEYHNEVYFLRKDNLMIRYDGENIVSFEDVMDPTATMDTEMETKLLIKLKAIIQQFTNRMIDNKLSGGE
jgi:phosphoglycerol transferase MdoB-like AlkP superfamily enzyme